MQPSMVEVIQCSYSPTSRFLAELVNFTADNIPVMSDLQIVLIMSSRTLLMMAVSTWWRIDRMFFSYTVDRQH